MIGNIRTVGGEVHSHDSSCIYSVENKMGTLSSCHKLHLVISPPILRQFPRSQSQLKALKKTFRSIPVTSRGDQ